MDKYVFYDTDIDGNEEYDIRGDNYKILMYTCCQYSSVLYLKYMEPDLQAYDKLKEFEIPKPQNIPEDSVYHPGYCEKRYYRVCPELYNILLDVADGIFEWINGWGFKNPENPIFYRNDGTVFFASEIHNGVCAIMPRENEDVEGLLRVIAWCTENNIRSWPTVWDM